MSLKEEEKGMRVIQRYCKDQYTEADLKTILKWYEENRYDLVRRTAMKKWWESHNVQGVENIKTLYDENRLLDRIHHQINSEEATTLKQKSGSFILRNFYKTFSRIAAILILPLLMFSIYLYQNNGITFQNKDIAYSKVHAPKNSRLRIQLPDGTLAWLNNGSSLKYPQQFAKHSRKVELAGEAYFHVDKDKSRPFQVIAEDLNIRVTGTAFNISAYKDDQEIITTVEEGSVALQQGDKKKRHITKLTASMQSIFRKGSNKTQIKKVNPQKYTAWKEGKLVLIDDPMKTVEKKLERWYNVEIEIQNQEIYSYKYTATFTHESIEQVMKYLSVATPISYEIKLGKKQPDNSFSKMKILINKNISRSSQRNLEN